MAAKSNYHKHPMKPSKLLVLAFAIRVHSLDVYVGGEEVEDSPGIISDFLDLPRIKTRIKLMFPDEKPLVVPVQQGKTLRESILNVKQYSKSGESPLRRKLKLSKKVRVKTSTPSTSIPLKVDEGSEIPVQTSVKLTSKRSWVAAFLAFKPPETSHLTPTTHSLHSTIKNYEDMVSDDSDLSAWTRFVVEEDKDTVSHKQYGGTQTKVVNVDEFINYLVKYHGFRRNDLAFLRRTDLDYGLDEIERELNKIKNRQDQEIDIGGEPTDVVTNESTSLHMNVYYMYLILLFVLF